MDDFLDLPPRTSRETVAATAGSIVLVTVRARKLASRVGPFEGSSRLSANADKRVGAPLPGVDAGKTVGVSDRWRRCRQKC